MYSTANPAYTADELLYQLQLTKAAGIFTHSASLSTAEEACRQAGIPSDRIVIIDSPANYAGPYITLESLVQAGLAKHPQFQERRLNPGEGATKIALLNFSSGTTGRPKAVAIAHSAVIANVIQMAYYGQANENYGPADRYRPGQVVLAGQCFYRIFVCIHAKSSCVIQFSHSIVSSTFQQMYHSRRLYESDIYGLIVVMHFYLFIGVGGLYWSNDSLLKTHLVLACRHATLFA